MACEEEKAGRVHFWAKLITEFIEDDGDRAKIKRARFLGEMESQLVALMSLESSPGKRGGSLPGKMPNVFRDDTGRHNDIVRQYFGSVGVPPLRSDAHFRRVWRVSRRVMLGILERVSSHDDYFQERKIRFSQIKEER